MVSLDDMKVAENSAFTEEIRFYAEHPICQNVNAMCYVSLLFFLLSFSSIGQNSAETFPKCIRNEWKIVRK